MILAPLGLGVGDQVGQVRAGQHRGLVDHQQGARADPDRAAGAAPSGQVAQELGGVVRPGHSGGQGVAGRLGRGDADHRAQPGLGPDAGGLGQHPGFAGSGWCVDDRYEPAVGQRGEGGGRLVLAQPGLRGLIVPLARVLHLAHVLRASDQRVLEPVRVGAERVRGVCPAHARRAVCVGVRDHAFFHGQLRARGVPHAAVPLVDAPPVRAQQAARHLHQFRRFQTDDRLELRGQRPVGQVFQQRGGRGRVHPGAGQDAAQVLDHIRAGPRALFLLRERDRLLHRVGQLKFGEHHAARARARAAALAVPDRRRDRRQRDAKRARELIRPARVRLREIQRAVLGVARA